MKRTAPFLKKAARLFLPVLLFSLLLAAPLQAQDWYTYFTDPDIVGEPGTGNPDGHDEIDEILEQRIRNFADNAGANSVLKLALYEIDNNDLITAIQYAQDTLVAKGGTGRVEIVADYGHSSNFSTLDGYNGLTISYSPSSGTGIMHNKFIIFDDSNEGSSYDNWVWTGSYNLTNNAQTRQRNNVILIRNTTLAGSSGFGHEFSEMYDNNRFGSSKLAPRSGTFTLDSEQGSFHFEQGGNSKQAIINAINTADEAIYFNIFAFTNTDIYDAIRDRINNGDIDASDVHGNFDRWWHRDSDYYDELLALGCDVNLVGMTWGVYIHDKFIVIDPDETGAGADPIVVTGSPNWTETGAFTTHDENLLSIHHGGIAQIYRDHQQGFGGIPEPSTIVLFMLGSSAAILFRRRRAARI